MKSRRLINCMCPVLFSLLLLWSLRIIVSKWDKKLQNSLDIGLIMILKSTMQPGHSMSA